MLDWQQWVLEQALMEDGRRKWSAFEVCLIVARQNGKNAILEALELADLFLFGARTVVHSAHKFDTAQEHFLRMRTLIESSDELMDLMPDDPNHGFITSNGKEQIRLRSGARLKFIARQRGGGRGYSGDRIIFDEAWELAAKSMGAMLPTLRARPNTQVWYTSSSAVPESTMLQALMKRGRADDPADKLFFAEWGNEPSVASDDLDAWYRANPSLGCSTSTWDGIAEEAMWNEYRSLVAGGNAELADEFRRECLGVAEVAAGEAVGPVSLERWAELVDPGSSVVGNWSAAIDVSPDMRWCSVAAVGRRADGHLHVEVVRRQPGTEWVVDFARRKAAELRVAFRVASASPAGFLIPLLEEAGVPVVSVSAGDVTQSCSRLVSVVADGTVHHLGGNELPAAIANATISQRGDARVWSRVKSSGDISALVAATIAVGGVAADVSDGDLWFSVS